MHSRRDMLGDILRVLGILLILLGVLFMVSSFSPPPAVPKFTSTECPTYSPTILFPEETPIGITLIVVGIVLLMAFSKMKRAAVASVPPVGFQQKDAV